MTIRGSLFDSSATSSLSLRAMSVCMGVADEGTSPGEHIEHLPDGRAHSDRSISHRGALSYGETDCRF